MDNFLIPLFSVLAVILLLPVFMVYVALIAGLGVFTWLFIVAMISPLVALWYVTVKKRVQNYINLLLDAKPSAWDMNKTLDEYEAMFHS